MNSWICLTFSNFYFLTLTHIWLLATTAGRWKAAWKFSKTWTLSDNICEVIQASYDCSCKSFNYITSVCVCVYTHVCVHTCARACVSVKLELLRKRPVLCIQLVEKRRGALMPSSITAHFWHLYWPLLLQMYKILVTGALGGSWVIFRRYDDFCRLKDKVRSK